MATKKELERIQALIGRVGAIAERWQAEGEISDMERELMLDKLRGLYEEVLFLDREGFAKEIAEASEAVAAAEPIESEPVSESSVESTVVAPEPVPEIVVEEETVAETVVKESVVWEAPESEDESAAEPEEEATPEPEKEPTPESEKEPEPEPVFESETPAAEPIAEPRTDAEPEKAPAAPAHETSASPRNRAAQDMIRALYGDMPAQGGARQPQPESEKSPEPQSVPQTDLFAEPATPAAPPRAAVPENGNGNGGKVLGEVLVGRAQAFNEVLGKQYPHEDVASRLRAGSVSDLRHSVGLNDRFLLIRELFAGDVSAYDKAISVLDAFTDFDDALIHIQENFNWRPDAEATLLLVDLLERKLEQR